MDRKAEYRQSFLCCAVLIPYIVYAATHCLPVRYALLVSRIRGLYTHKHHSISAWALGYTIVISTCSKVDRPT